MIQIVIYGAGGSAREVAWLAQQCVDSEGQPKYEVACLIDDDSARHGELVNGIPIYGLPGLRQKFPSAKMVGGVGDPQARQKLMERAAEAGFAFESIIHSTALLSNWVEYGEGAVIYPGNILTTNVRIGRHLQTNVHCAISHDAVLGDYVTLGPGVHISGWVQLGDRVSIGAGATIINGSSTARLTIGDDAVVGAGACVIRPVPSGVTVAGVPAKPIS
jgi:sugar O-acyltransferase (sialic acid O-acetyltransferase NeuD family)